MSPNRFLSAVFLAVCLAHGALAQRVYTDNFDAGMQLPWGNQRGGWTVTSGEYAADAPSAYPPTATMLPYVAGDFVFEADVADPLGGGFWLRADSVANSGVLLVLQNDQIYWHVLADALTGPYTVYGFTPISPPLPLGTTHLRVVATGAVLRAFVGTSPTATTTLDLSTITTPPGLQFLRGRVGLFDYAAPQTRFDNVRLTAYDQLPLDAAGWWPGENTAIDALGNANGALVGNVGFVEGKSGRAFHFGDNGGNYVSIPDGTTSDLPAQFSLEGWVRPLAGLSNPSSAYGIFSKAGPPYAAGIAYQIVLPYAGNLDAYAQSLMRSDAQSWPVNQVTGGLTDTGIWSHIVWTYDQSVSRVYVDGTEVANSPVGPLALANVGADLRLNCDGYGSVCSPLDIDEAVVYHRALSASEVNLRYRQLAAREVQIPYRQDMLGTLDANWQVVNRVVPTLQFQPDGSLRMTTTNTDLYGASNNIANMPVLRLPAGVGDVAVSAAFRFDASPTALYQQSGILLLNDSSGRPDQDNYLRLSYAYEPQPRFEAVFDVAGVPNGDIPNGPLIDIPAATPYWMQLARRGSQYTLSYSLDGERFTQFYATSPPLAPVYAGLFALHANPSAPATSFDALAFDVSSLCVAEPSGLISHWRGNSLDDELARNRLSAANGAGFAMGRIGRGFLFNGSDQSFGSGAPQGLPLGSAARTVALWARTPRNLSATTESALFEYGTQSSGQTFGLITSGNAPGKLYFYGNSQDLGGATTLVPDTWYHLAASYDGGTLRLYVNGKPDGSAALSLNTVLSPDGLTLGLRPPATVWQGLIDDVQLYGRALADAEVDALHRAGAAGLCLRDPIFANGFE